MLLMLIMLLMLAQQHTSAVSTSATPMYACRTPASQSQRYCDASLPTAVRVAALLAELTVPEKLGLMGAAANNLSTKLAGSCSFQDAGVPRLDIPIYKWCVEDNTGVSSRCIAEGKCATTFPSPAVLGASFNRSLWRMKGAVQGEEHRAIFNLNGTRGVAPNLMRLGLNGWAPNINVVRDPRYGRNSEVRSQAIRRVISKKI